MTNKDHLITNPVIKEKELELNKIWICSVCGTDYKIKPDHCIMLMTDDIYCSGVMMPYISKKDLVEWLENLNDNLEVKYQTKKELIEEILNHIKGE